MATSVDMSLDDIIKKNRERGGRGRGRARRGRGAGGSFSNGGRMPVAARRGPLSVNARPSLYSIAKELPSLNFRTGALTVALHRFTYAVGQIPYSLLLSFNLEKFGHMPPRRARTLPWKNDLLEDSIRASGITGIEVGTKLYVSNLDYGVTNEDIRELFSEVGDLKRYAIHYDKTGRSSGSAEVVYTRRSDAFAALKKYNNVLLDGKPMKIEVVGASGELPISARVNVTGANGRRKRTVVVTPGPGRIGGPAVTNRAFGQQGSQGSRRGGGLRNGRGRGRGGGGGGRGRGRGRGKKPPTEKSADDLDKDLDKYHAEATAMQT